MRPRRAVLATRTFGDGGSPHTAHMDFSDRFVDCPSHEFMHVLGIDNHWSGPFASAAIPSVLAPLSVMKRRLAANAVGRPTGRPT